jgi:hypothetical protein
VTRYPRLRMRLAMTKHELPADRRFRGVEAGGRPALATLLLDAYRGTVDDEGESEEEGEIASEAARGRPPGRR